MPHTDERDYYVSCRRDDGKTAFLAGPFQTHTEALARVDVNRQAAIKIDQWLHFASFGTCSLPRSESNPKGKINA